MTTALILVATLVLSQQRTTDDDKRLTELLDLLAHGELRQQIGAAQELGRLGHSQARVLGHLEAAMHSSHCSLSLVAANALWTTTRNASRVLPVLRVGLSNPDPECRAEAARGLGKLGLEALPAVAELIGSMKAAEWQTRAAAAEALGQIGPEARSALPSLETALREDPMALVQEAARRGIYKIDTETGIRELKALLRSSETLDRLLAASILAQMGSRAAGAVPELLIALEDRRPGPRPGDARGVSFGYDVTKARMQAATALGSIGPRAKQALPLLERLERAPEEDEGVRRAARQAIRAIR